MADGQEDVAGQVLAYLRAHPSAADTLEGIAGWWLERRRVIVSVETVASAVQHLIEIGVVEEFQRGGADAPLFRIAKGRY